MRRRALLAALVALAAAREAHACASCGSGGDEPMVLYPNEHEKFYLGLARTAGFQNVDRDGALSTAGGPSRKETATFAFGHAFSPRTFATLAAPFTRNVLGDDQRTAFADPSLAARHTVVMPSLAEPLIPQVQLGLGYKYGQATSIHDSRLLKTQLDVFGNGFSEAKAAADVWYGQTAVKFGAAHAVLVPLARRFAGSTYAPGLGQRTTASVSYAWPGMVKTTGGANREARAPLRIDGDEQPDSAQVNNALFLTGEWMVSPLDTARVSFARQAAFARNRNTARSNAVSFAYMKSI